MGLPIHPLVTETHFARNSRTRKAIVFIGLFLLCVLGAYALEFSPHFRVLSIRLPADDYGPGSWDSTTYSVLNPGLGRVFVWRKDGYVGYANANELEKLHLTEKYFSDELTKLGWATGDSYDICSTYLPEAKILVQNQKGNILEFHEKQRPIYDSGAYFGDLACVAVLEYDRGGSESDRFYYITLLTARLSPLKILFDYLGGL